MTENTHSPLHSGGPAVFRARLMEHLDLPPGTVVANPHPHEVAVLAANPPALCIARLDGAAFYRATGPDLYGMIRQRRPQWAGKLAWVRFGTYPEWLAGVLLNRYLNRSSRRLVRMAHGIVFQSELSRTMHRLFCGYKQGQKPETIILNGVDVDVFHPGAAHGQRLEGAPAVIASSATWRLHKRLHEAVNLINKAAADHPGIHLHVLGEPDVLVREQLDTTENLDLSRCTFHGRKDPAELPAFYAGADLMLHPAMLDNCPNAVAEGLACGLPVLTPRRSGAAELVGPDNKDWVTDDGVQAAVQSVHRADALPFFPMGAWRGRLDNVMADLPTAREKARQRAVDALDIRETARQYAAFIETCRGSAA